MYDRILVPIDGSTTAQAGLRSAVTLAKRLGSHLVLLNVLDDFPLTVEWASAMSFEETLLIMRKQAQEMLSGAKASVADEGVPVETVLKEIRQNTVADAIVEQARERNCDLIVMGTHGLRGLKRLTMGSDAELVVRASPVPVMLVKAGDSAAVN